MRISHSRTLAVLVPALLLIVSGSTTVLAAAPVDDAYSRTCAACHGAELRGGETGPALIGAAFQQKWASVPASVLEAYTRGSMPPTNPGGLSAGDYASAVARIRANNGLALVQAAVQGMGITVQPDFMAEPFLARGEVLEILQDFAPPPLGIYAVLPSNRYIPHRVNVLLEHLATSLHSA